MILNPVRASRNGGVVTRERIGPDYLAIREPGRETGIAVLRLHFVFQYAA